MKSKGEVLKEETFGSSDVKLSLVDIDGYLALDLFHHGKNIRLTHNDREMLEKAIDFIEKGEEMDKLFFE